jgi:putative Mg2+ transporter-C (MgtC) family protein
MGFWLDQLRAAFPDLPDAGRLIVPALRLLAAAVLGSLIGWQREQVHKPAGIRTHMLVALGAAAFVVCTQQVGLDQASVSRVVQGLLAGIGFIGAGTILRRGHGQIEGVTTAASVWVVAAVGTAVGLGSAWTAIAATVLAVAILAIGARKAGSEPS